MSKQTNIIEIAKTLETLNKEIQWITGVYARVSTDHDDQRLSNEHQIQYFKEWAINNGHTIHDYYVDEGISGTSIKKRLAFQRLIQDAENGKVNCIVSKSISRFARNQVDSIRTVRRLKDKGVRFIFIEQGIDTYKPDGDRLLGLWAWHAEEESRTLSSRRKFGGRQSQKNGRFITNRPPLGYKSENQRLTIDTTEAPIIRQIFDMYLQGKGCQAIAVALNNTGIRSRKGEAFAKTKIQYILENPAYKGTIVGNRYTTTDVTTKKRIENPPEEWIVVENAHPYIIEPSQFDKAQSIMNDRRFTITKRTIHPLTGLLKCKECGHGMMRKHNKKKNGKEYSYYVCTTKTNKSSSLCDSKPVKEETMLELVDMQLKFLKHNKEELIELRDESYKEIRKRKNVAQDNIKNIEDQIKKVSERRNVLSDKYLDGKISDDIYQLKEKQLVTELKNLTKQKEQTHNTNVAESNFQLVFDQFVNALDKFDSIDNATNILLKDLIDEIWIDKEGNAEVITKSQITNHLYDTELVGDNAQIVTTIYPYTQPKEEECIIYANLDNIRNEGVLQQYDFETKYFVKNIDNPILYLITTTQLNVRR